jgi:hypothetical protein
MIEAMACGTPVLAFNKGSVSEIVEPGVTGFLVDSVEEANRKIGDLLSLNRRLVRKRFEERFSASRMAGDYAKLYRQLLESSEDSVSIAKNNFGPSIGPTSSHVESWRTLQAPGSLLPAPEKFNGEI